MEERTCRVCGCTEEDVNDAGGSWAEKDLCSSCVDEDDLNLDEENKENEATNTSEADERILWESADDKLKSEYEKFSGGAKEKAVSKPVLEALLLFCKDYNFAKAVENNKKTFGNCITEILNGVGNSISDLELYQKAAAFYFPKAKISFVMTIDTDGVVMPVESKEVIAELPNKQAKTKQNNATAPVKSQETESKKIVINLDGLL